MGRQGERTMGSARSIDSRRSCVLLGLSLAVWLGVGRGVAAADVDFTREVRPILSDHCYHCHGPDEGSRQGDLRLDQRDAVYAADRSPPVVVAGDPQASLLIQRIMSEEPSERMPPPESKHALSEAQIATLRQWVAEGAIWQDHWSFQPLAASPVPRVATDRFPDHEPRNPIDLFVTERLAAQGLRPAPRASREQLLRRVTLDLTGLPPTIEELDAFLADESPDAYERVVARLLASPRYGERMAWDWLDAARYADSNGFQGDNDRTMWPWRDWVIGALNDDLPFDQFTLWQLAGDRLPNPTLEQRLATGFSRNHMINGEGGRIPEENRVEYVFDQMETMGTVWLGLTLQCCRCHDHKFDPISRREYFQLFAFFNQTPVDGGGGNPQTPPTLAVASSAQQRDLASRRLLLEELADRIQQQEQAFRDNLAKLEPETGRQMPLREALEQPLRERSDERLQLLLTAAESRDPEYAARIKSYRDQRAQRNALENSLPRVMVMEDRPERRPTPMLEKGLYNKLGELVDAGTPAVFAPLPAEGSADRLKLARWLLDRKNPLTARVTVNRHWQAFFGNGLVRTPEDFGIQGERPTHPELLDWLAHDLLTHGWNIRRLHRLIVQSATYQQSARRATTGDDNDDPDNLWLSRGPRMRMPSWMLRDQALAASGLLTEQLGGPPVNPYQPAEVWPDATFGNKQYTQSHGSDLYRRSVYTFWRRIVGPTLFFDAGKRQTCTVRVPITNTPLHSLTVLNDPTYLEAARVLSQQAMTSEATDGGRIALAFRQLSGRRPTDAELEVLLARLLLLKQQFAADAAAAEQFLAVGEWPRDPSLDRIEHAAFTGLCSLLMNLDEVLCK